MVKKRRSLRKSKRFRKRNRKSIHKRSKRMRKTKRVYRKINRTRGMYGGAAVGAIPRPRPASETLNLAYIEIICCLEALYTLFSSGRGGHREPGEPEIFKRIEEIGGDPKLAIVFTTLMTMGQNCAQHFTKATTRLVDRDGVTIDEDGKCYRVNIRVAGNLSTHTLIFNGDISLLIFGYDTQIGEDEIPKIHLVFSQIKELFDTFKPRQTYIVGHSMGSTLSLLFYEYMYYVRSIKSLGNTLIVLFGMGKLPNPIAGNISRILSVNRHNTRIYEVFTVKKFRKNFLMKRFVDAFIQTGMIYPPGDPGRWKTHPQEYSYVYTTNTYIFLDDDGVYSFSEAIRSEIDKYTINEGLHEIGEYYRSGISGESRIQ